VPSVEAQSAIVSTTAGSVGSTGLNLSYPHGRPGYVVDHIIPLKRGGADEPWNMQWQTITEGKAKDARE
jgi:hypothetical protein